MGNSTTIQRLETTGDNQVPRIPRCADGLLVKVLYDVLMVSYVRAPRCSDGRHLEVISLCSGAISIECVSMRPPLGFGIIDLQRVCTDQRDEKQGLLAGAVGAKVEAPVIVRGVRVSPVKGNLAGQR